MDVRQGYVIRTVSTFDDATFLRKRDANHDEGEDRTSPKSAMDFQGQSIFDKKNTSMASETPRFSSRSLTRNLSDSQLVFQMSRSMHSWKCNLCFYNNLNSTQTVCAMCGTDMDASFMAGLNALDSLKDPSILQNEDDNVDILIHKNDEDADFECVKRDERNPNAHRNNDKDFPTPSYYYDDSYRTAEDHATLISFETARQSFIMKTDASTIHPETVVTEFHECDDEVVNVHENDHERNSRNLSDDYSFGKKNSSNSKMEVSHSCKSRSDISIREKMLKLSESLMDASLNSSITMLDQESTVHNTALLDSNITQKTAIDSKDDSIRTLLNVTHPEEDDSFDPMLFQGEELEDGDSLIEGVLEESNLSHGHGSIHSSSQRVPSLSSCKATETLEETSGHHHTFEKEIDLDEYIQKSQEEAANQAAVEADGLSQAEDDVEGKEIGPRNIDENQNKCQLLVEVSMGDEEVTIVQENDSLVSRRVWLVRGGVVLTVLIIVIVSFFVI